MNRKSLLQITGILCLCLLLGSQVLASGHGQTKPVKKGILLVTFGSSYPQARASFENIESEVSPASGRPDI